MTEESLFAAALARGTSAERKAFLDEACRADAALRQRVEQLLLCHDRAEHFLEQPAVQQMAPARLQTQGSATHAEAVRADHSDVLRLLEPPARPGALARLKHYEVLEVLGAGGFGTVLKVFDDRLHRVVAIKVLAPELAVNATARQRFLREARATAAIRHDNVIDIHVVDEEPLPHLVMGYIEGQTLQQKLDRSGPLPLKEILRIGVQVAEGLAAAHKQGLIHRDVKPSNILLENGVERVKLSDFGLARRMSDDASLTQTGLIAGTPQYMSPEQADGKALDQRSDLFSVGSVLYALCTGRPPFEADSTLAVLRRVCDATPRPIRELSPEIPEWLAFVIDKLLAKKPAERIQSAPELADLLAMRLAELQIGGPAQAETHKPESRRQHQPKKSGRVFRLRNSAFCICALTLLSSLAVWLGLARPWESAGGPELLDPGPTVAGGKLPSAAELAVRSSPAEALRREAIAPQLLSTLFGQPKLAPPGLVAVLGDDRFLLPRGDGLVMRIHQSADGKLLAVPKGKEILLFETPSGKHQRSLHISDGAVRRVVFSPDSQLLAAVSWDNEGKQQSTVWVWDIADGWKVLDRLPPPTRSVDYLLFTPDSKSLLTSGTQGQPLCVADARTGEKRREIERGPEYIGVLGHSGQTGKLFPIADACSKQVSLWDTETWQEVRTFERQTTWVGDVAVSPDGKLLALSGLHWVKLCRIETGETALTLQTPGECVAFSPDSKILLTWAAVDPASHTVTRWDVASGQKLDQYTVPGPRDHFFPILSRDGADLYLTYQSAPYPHVRVIDAATGRERPRHGHTGPVHAVAISADGKQLASAGADRSVRLWDLATGRQSHLLGGHGASVLSVAFSTDGKLLASGSADRSVRLWDTVTGKQLHTLTDPTGEVRQVVFAPDGAVLAAASLDGIVRLWDVRAVHSGGAIKLLHKLAGARACWAIAFSPDGKTLAAGDEHGAIRLWDTDKGWPAAQLPGHSSRVRSLAFHKDGQTLASTGDEPDSSVRLWDMTTLTPKHCLPQKDGPVLSSVWRADGGMLATCGGKDGSVRLWDTTVHPPRGKALPGLQIGQSLHAVALTPEGRYLATANPDGTIYVLNLAMLVEQ